MANQDLEETWRIELQPVLTEFAAYLRKHPHSDRPVFVPVANKRIEVTPAEREVVLRTAERGGAKVARHFCLVTDGLILRAKLLEDEAELADASEEARPQAGARVRHDIDIGYKVVHAMQGEISVLMATGKVEHGRRVAEHRGHLTEALQRAQRILVELGFEPPEAPSATSAVNEKGPTSSRPGRRGESRQTPKWLPQAVAGLLFALLAVLLLQLWSQRTRDLPPLTVNDFASFPGVQQVVCRPPGVIVILPGDRWGKLSREGRVQAVQNAALAVEHLGYRRMEVRSARGTPLAVWRKGGKVVIHH